MDAKRRQDRTKMITTNSEENRITQIIIIRQQNNNNFQMTGLKLHWVKIWLRLFIFEVKFSFTNKLNLLSELYISFIWFISLILDLRNVLKSLKENCYFKLKTSSDQRKSRNASLNETTTLETMFWIILKNFWKNQRF